MKSYTMFSSSAMADHNDFLLLSTTTLCIATVASVVQKKHIKNEQKCFYVTHQFFLNKSSNFKENGVA